MTLVAEYGPYAVVLLALLIASVVALFAMFRADNIRAGEPYPTKLAVAQTFSALRNGRATLAKLRGKGEPTAEAPREFHSAEEMKATITPGTLRADDIPAYPPRRSPARSERVE